MDDFALMLPGSGEGGTPGNPLAYNPMFAADGQTLESYRVNGARAFNGTDQTLSLADHPDVRLDASMWISARFRVNALTGAGMILLAKNTEWRIYQHDADTMIFMAEDSAAGTLFQLLMELENNAPFDDKWLMFTGFIDLAQRRATAHINGQRYTAPFDGANPPLVAGNPFTIGSRNGALFLDGTVASVLIGKPPTALADLQDEIRLATENFGNPLDCRQLSADQLARWGCADTVWPMDGGPDADEPSTSGVHTLLALPEGSGPISASGPPEAYVIGYKAV